MTDKDKKILFLVCIISILFSFCLEILIFNKNVFRDNKIYYPKIIESNGLEKTKDGFKTTSNNASITLKFNSNYLNKIKFNYKSDEDYSWILFYKVGNKEISTGFNSSSLTNKAIKKIGLHTDIVKVKFNKKNLSFSNIRIDNKIYINYARVIIFIILFIGLYLLIKYHDYLINNIDKAFLYIAIPCGLLFILFVPKYVYTSWDDQIHIKNSYVFLATDTAKIPNSIDTIISFRIDNSMFSTPEEKTELYKKLNSLNKDYTTIQVNNYGTKFTKLIYLPYFIGFKFAELFSFNYTSMIICAKLFNFVCYALLFYFAIKISYSFKKIIFLIGVMPLNIFLASQFSYDPLITAFLTMAFTLFFNMLEDKKISRKKLIAFVMCVILGSLPKAIYSPMLFLILFLPDDKFKNKKEAMEYKIITFLIGITLMASFVLPAVGGGVAGDVRGGNTGVSGQLSGIINNPLNYLYILIRFFIEQGPSLFIGKMTIAYPGYLSLYTSPFLDAMYLIYLILFMYVLYSKQLDKKVYNNKMKIVFIILYLGLFTLISTGLYLSFTEIGSKTISGVQSRYFIPMLLLLFAIISSTTKDKKVKDNAKSSLIIIIPFVFLIGMLLCFNIFGKLI